MQATRPPGILRPLAASSTLDSVIDPSGAEDLGSKWGFKGAPTRQSLFQTNVDLFFFFTVELFILFGASFHFFFLRFSFHFFLALRKGVGQERQHDRVFSKRVLIFSFIIFEFFILSFFVRPSFLVQCPTSAGRGTRTAIQGSPRIFTDI